MVQLLQEFDCQQASRDAVLVLFSKFLKGKKFRWSRATPESVVELEGGSLPWWSETSNGIACMVLISNPFWEGKTKASLWLQFNNPASQSDQSWDRVELDDECLSVYSTEGEIRWSLKVIKE